MKTANNPASLVRILARDQARLVEALGLDQREGRLEAQVLLAKALGVNRAYLIAHAEDIPDEALLSHYHAMLERRIAGEPVAYILGEREFYGLRFKVSPAVLIPRPETELLVELALARIPADSPIRILDLGTGSGAIAISLAKQRPNAFVVGLDQSGQALRVAQSNATALQASNVAFVRSDWFSGLSVRKFDIVVSNPPYIPDLDPHLLQGDLRFEPRSALAAGADGLDCVRRIACEAAQYLSPGGWLMIEHAYNQADKVAALYRQAGFSAINAIRDLSGIERVTIGKLA